MLNCLNWICILVQVNALVSFERSRHNSDYALQAFQNILDAMWGMGMGSLFAFWSFRIVKPLKNAIYPGNSLSRSHLLPWVPTGRTTVIWGKTLRCLAITSVQLCRCWSVFKEKMLCKCRANNSQLSCNCTADFKFRVAELSCATVQLKLVM